MTKRPQDACGAENGGIPACDTGPGGRLLFVLSEARKAWRDRTRPTPKPSSDSDLTRGPQ